MRYEDEPYVRKYTRKTLTNRLLGWEGRAVLDAMLGEFDAAGVFDFRGDPVRSIVAVTDIPEDFVRVGLERLIETETWTVTSSRIVWPTFEEAQNCTRSDRERQRISRKKRTEQALNEAPPPSSPASVRPAAPAAQSAPPAAPEPLSHAVTPARPAVTACDESGHGVTNVTSGHAESQPVTPCHGSSQNVTLPSFLPLLPSSLPPRDPPVGPPRGDEASSDPDEPELAAEPEPDSPPGNRPRGAEREQAPPVAAQPAPSRPPQPPPERPPPERGRKRARALPGDLAPNAGCVSLARELGVSLEREFPAFLDHHRAKGSVFADWQAALRTWLRNAQRYGPKRASANDNSRFATSADERLRRQADRVRLLREQELRQQHDEGFSP